MTIPTIYRAWLRQAVRILVAVALSALVARLCGLPEAPWALITAVIVTSNSVTSTWAAGRDQIVGTLIGAVAGTAAIGLTLLGLPPLPVFAAMLCPLALLAAARPNLRLTCVTLIVVFLFPSASNNPFERPLNRLAAILIGALVSLAVSALVFRPRARADAFTAAGQMLQTLEALLEQVLSAERQQPDRDRLMEQASGALRRLIESVTEARREHLSALEQSDPVLVRLVPMLRRLQSDVLFVARAVDEIPDPQIFRQVLRPPCAALGAVIRQLRLRCEQLAQGHGRLVPATERSAEIEQLDRSLEGLGDVAGVPLRFTLQMMRRDLDDLEIAIQGSGAGQGVAGPMQGLSRPSPNAA